MKSYRLSTVKYPKYTLAESALVLSEMNQENKKAPNGRPELPENKNKEINANLAMKFLLKTWEWVCDINDDVYAYGWGRLIAWLQNSIRIIIWLGIIIGICWLLFNLPRAVIIILFFIIIGIVGNLYYKEKRHTQHLKRKYDEVLTKLRRIQDKP